MDKGSERSARSSAVQSYTVHRLGYVISPHVHQYAVVPGTSVLEHMSVLTARAKTARVEDPIYPEDPIMRGMWLCDEGTPLISDSAQKNPISIGDTILRSHFPVCLTGDPTFAKGISFLGQRRLYAYGSTRDAVSTVVCCHSDPNHSPCKHVENSYLNSSSSTVGRVRSQCQPQSRPQSGMTSRSDSMTSTRDTENRLSRCIQSKPQVQGLDRRGFQGSTRDKMRASSPQVSPCWPRQGWTKRLWRKKGPEKGCSIWKTGKSSKGRAGGTVNRGRGSWK
jgi:hypothetical protein